MAETAARALTSLAFATLRDDDRIPLEPLAEERDLIPLERALFDLADAEDVPRLVKLDQIVRLAVRRPELLRGEGPDGLDAFLRSVVDPGGTRLDDLGVQAAVEVVEDALRDLGGVEVNLGVAWDRFTASTNEVLALTEAELRKPRCDDREEVARKTVGGQPFTASQVIVTFDSTSPVGHFVPYVDPIFWPTCTTYFPEMKPLGPRLPLTNIPGYTGWQADYEEHCDSLPAKTLVTPLHFEHRAAIDGSHLRTTYELLAETPDILFDSGFIDVIAIGPPEVPLPRTRITALKVIAFVDPLLDQWPSAACDLFWTELAIDMALGCKQDPTTTGSATEGASMPQMPPDKVLEQQLDQATQHAKDSLDTYQAYGEAVIACLTSKSPPDPQKVCADASSMWAQMWKDSVYCWLTAFNMAQEVAKVAPSKPSPGDGP